MTGGLGTQGVEAPRVSRDDDGVVSERYVPGDQECFVVGTASIDGEEVEANEPAPGVGKIVGAKENQSNQSDVMESHGRCINRNPAIVEGKNGQY